MVNLFKIGGLVLTGANMTIGRNNSTFRKVGRGVNLIKVIIITIILFLFGAFLFFIFWPIALFVWIIAFSSFYFSIKFYNKEKKVAKWSVELKEDLNKDEKVLYFISPITNAGLNNDEGKIVENTLIVTDKRIIFMYIPMFSFEDLTYDFSNSMKRIFSYDGYNKKVQELLGENGLFGMIHSTSYCFGIKYDELIEVKLNNFWSKVKFVTKKGNFKYHLRRKKIEELKKIFANYVKI